MKRLIVCVVSAGLMSIPALAAEFKGTLSDAGCGAKHANASEADAKCAQKCVNGGAMAVLVSGDKVYKIDKESQAKVKAHVGHKVTVSGTADGDTIKVDSVKM